MRRLALVIAVLAVLAADTAAGAGPTTVATDAELRAALANLRPGDELVIRAGRYRGGVSLTGLAAPASGVTLIRGADSKDPPVFEGGVCGWRLSDCNGVTLRSLVVRGASGNGINVDDGGSFDTPARGITVEDVTIADTGPRGNCDALKMSGVERFVVRDCRFEGWGGSAIDMVGCHDGRVTDCRFAGKDGFDQASGVQMKGGTEDVLVQCSFFDKAGERAINFGGSTGIQYFRPKPGEFEARRITVAGNRFVGSTAPVAFVNADASRVVRNTIVHPAKWVLRILQEQRAPGFLPCRGCAFEENLVVTDARVTTFVNVGPDTAADTFTFRRNAWSGGTVRPQLPSPEKDGVYGVDPQLEAIGTPEMRMTSKDARLRDIGADAYERAK